MAVGDRGGSENRERRLESPRKIEPTRSDDAVTEKPLHRRQDDVLKIFGCDRRPVQDRRDGIGVDHESDRHPAKAAIAVAATKRTSSVLIMARFLRLYEPHK